MHPPQPVAPQRARSQLQGTLAWLVCALSMLFAVPFLFLLMLNSGEPGVDTYEYWGASLVQASLFPLVGALIVARTPASRLGWAFCAIGSFTAVGDFATEYSTRALLIDPGVLLGGVVAAWVSSFASDVGFLSLPLILLLFPDGRAATPRWEVTVWLAVGAVALATVSSMFMPGMLGIRELVENPVGIASAGGALEQMQAIALTGVLISFFAGVASLAVRYRRSRGVERQQVKWFIFAALVLPLGLLGNTLLPGLSWLLGGLVMATIPTAVGIAVLRYRLYDIDIVISRTLIYGALTLGVAGVYVLLVGGISALLQVQGNVLVSILAAGLVAVLVQPVRRRLQGAVNQLMYGERHDPYGVLSRLSQRLRATLSPEVVLDTIVETVAGALKLPYAAIDLERDGGGFETVAEVGERPRGEPLILPLLYASETVGQLVLSPRAPNEPFSAADRRLLDGIARHAETAVHSVRLTNELQRSREWLVNVREEERRRLRRDLHDDLGPQLATISLKLDAARNLLHTRPEATEALLAELTAQTQAAIGDLRRVVYNLRPPSLDELGLVAAICEQAAEFSRNGLSVCVDAPEPLPPLPAAVEVAAYRITQEALTNVRRHARARECQVRFRVNGALLVEIEDDGVGVGAAARPGVGLSSMHERAAELGGMCAVERAAGGGTRVSARFPLRAEGAW